MEDCIRLNFIRFRIGKGLLFENLEGFCALILIFFFF